MSGLRVLEFYSGIGGMRCAVEELRARSRAGGAGGGGAAACVGKVLSAPPVFVGAYDVSTAANDVYACNYSPHRASQKRNA